VIKPVLSNITSIEIRLGKLNFIVYDQFISLKNKEIDSLEISEYNPPSFNLLHFNCSENHIWISVFSLDRIKNDANFIKVVLQRFLILLKILSSFYCIKFILNYHLFHEVNLKIFRLVWVM